MPNIFPSLTNTPLGGLRRLATWLPPLLAITVIACESTNTFSSEHTSGWLRPIFERLLGTIQETTWLEFHHLVRKTGHFIGYGLVCLSFLFTWLWEFARRIVLSINHWRIQSALAAVLSTAAVAGLDEWHQTFIPSRTGLVSDALLDTTGGCVMILLIWFAGWHRAADRR